MSEPSAQNAPDTPHPPEIEQAGTPPPRELDERGRAKRTRISWVWIGLAAAAIVLILLIIFIAQNTKSVTIHYLGFDGQVSVGLALLISAICGVVIALVPGTIRILQLRRSVRRLGAEHTSGTPRTDHHVR